MRRSTIEPVGRLSRTRLAGALLTLVLTAASPVWAATPAQAASAKPTDPLRLASGSIESLVQRVSRSVVQVVVSGYQPLDASGRTDVALGRGRVIGSGI